MKFVLFAILAASGVIGPFDIEKLINRNSGQVLALSNGATTENTQAVQQEYTQAGAQLWAFEEISDSGYVFIKSVNSNLVLGVLNRTATEDAPVQLQVPALHDTQQWKIISLTNGYVQIANKSGGKVLSVVSNSLSNGADIVLKDSSGDFGQQWTVSLEKLKVSGDSMVTDNPLWSNKPIVLRGAGIRGAKRIDVEAGAPGYVFSMKTLAGIGCSVVRIPCQPSFFGEDIGLFLDTYVTPIVMKANELGMYAIVDFHLSGDATASASINTASNFWAAATPRYANWPGVLFQVFNEHNNTNWPALKAVIQPHIDYIRSQADNIIICATAQYNLHLMDCVGDLYAGTNLVYALHMYPNVFPYRMGKVMPLIDNEDVPIFMTEWGFNNDLPDGDFRKATVTSYAQPLREFVDLHKISWSAWTGDTVWYIPMFWPDWTLRSGENYSGEFTANWLSEMSSVYSTR